MDVILPTGWWGFKLLQSKHRPFEVHTKATQPLQSQVPSKLRYLSLQHAGGGVSTVVILVTLTDSFKCIPSI